MRWGGVALAGIALLLEAHRAIAQTQPASENLLMTARSAFTWTKAGTEYIQLDGGVTITLDRAAMTARQAVVWIPPATDPSSGIQQVHIELIGDIVLRQQVGTRSGGQLFVTTEFRGEPRITAEERVARDMSGSPLYRRAEALRKEAAPVEIRREGATTSPSTATTGPTTRAGRAATRPAPEYSVHLEAGQTDTTDAEDGTVAIVAWGGVKLVARPNSAAQAGDMLELQAQRAVLFTTLQSLRDIGKKQQQAEKARQQVTAVYLEGDAQIEYESTRPGMGEQRLMADRVYYELGTDRAILLNAVLHTMDPQRGVPFIVRAKTLRQLAKGEYAAKGVQLTSSAFAVPSYSIAADRLYVRSEPTGDPQFPERIEFEAAGATLEAFDVPFFYLPYVAGSIGDRPGALRDIAISHRSDLGYSFLSQWGLFETLGKVPPKDLDAAYRVDYFSDRGPGFGLDAAYGGGFLTEPSHLPWNFQGDLKGYFVYDKGTDTAYGRLPVKPDGPGSVPRGRVLFENQHFFPGDWEAQVRLAYVSDPTFLEEWFPREFYEEGPEDLSVYLKRQRDSEAFTLLAEAQPNRLVTTSDRMAEQFEVERLPEVGYHRIGDSVAGDRATFFSDNTVGGLDFQPTRATLRQQGFALPTINPGIPALGTTGVTTSTTWRGDFREELDFPLRTGHFNLMPYLVGRYTEYSRAPGDGELSRFFGAAGVRINTSFWKTDPTAESDVFDIHQLRHVIEPEANLFTSATTIDRTRLFQYDEQIDAINDISAAEVGVRQRWQTQRGGPGRWRNVDVFTLDIDAEFYANKPNPKLMGPFNFRGEYFPSLPETSVARDALNADASWRISDNTVVLGDAQYNLNESKLATAALGVLVRRDVVLSFYLGNRYIADLNSNITTVAASYQISPKYTLAASQAFDFGLGQNVSSSFAAIRYFDRFIMVLRLSYDEIGNQTSVSFNLIPIGFGQGLGTQGLQGPFHR